LECMAKYFSSQIQEGKVLGMQCPIPNCTYEPQMFEVKYALSGPILEKYDTFLVDAHLKSDPNSRWCPQPKCGVGMIGDMKDSKNPMLQCPKCKFRFCFNCKTDEFHTGSTCEDFQEWKKLNGKADVLFSEWSQKYVKICPKCRVPIEKNGGCDHMTCRSCKYEFYWSSGKPYRKI